MKQLVCSDAVSSCDGVWAEVDDLFGEAERERCDCDTMT